MSNSSKPKASWTPSFSYIGQLGTQTQVKTVEQSYLDGKALNDRLLRGEAADGDPLESVGGLEDEAPSDADLVAFALEAHLRDFIIKNLSQIPIDGNRLRLYVNAEGRGGKEYPTNVGPIRHSGH